MQTSPCQEAIEDHVYLFPELLSKSDYCTTLKLLILLYLIWWLCGHNCTVHFPAAAKQSVGKFALPEDDEDAGDGGLMSEVRSGL